jgi:hypothetical protein
MTARPRCGKPMLRYEKAAFPALEDPACGRPEDHKGRCRSAAAMARYLAADAARNAGGGGRRATVQKRTRRLHVRLIAVIEAAVAQAEAAAAERDRRVLAEALEASPEPSSGTSAA